MGDTKAATVRNAASPERLAWDEIREPGAYVEVTTGHLYRVSRENLDRKPASRPGTSRAQAPQFVQLSRDPAIFPLGARILCARHHIAANF